MVALEEYLEQGMAYRHRHQGLLGHLDHHAHLKRLLLQALKEYNHRKVAVVFQADAETLQQRRANRPGKTIPQHVLNHMKLEMPSLDEGFDEIILVNA